MQLSIDIQLITSVVKMIMNSIMTVQSGAVAPCTRKPLASNAVFIASYYACVCVCEGQGWQILLSLPLATDTGK